MIEELHKLLPGGKPAAAPPERDIEAEVRAAVKAAKTTEERDSLVVGLKTDVEQLKAAAQKAPRQERRIERFMGWRIDEE